MINKSIYIVLSAISFSGFLFLVGLDSWLPAVVLFGGVILNHYLLVKGVGALVKSKPKSAYLVLKMFVLILVFIYAMHSMPEHILLSVFAYIFQLIILALSIKRDNKKIKDFHK